VAGTTAETLTINGVNFLPVSTVSYNGQAHSATFVSATELTVPLSAADLATPGSYPVAVTNSSPGGGASSAFEFTVLEPVTTEQQTTNSQGQASFADAGINIQVNDIITQQPVPELKVTLLFQQGIASAVSVSDPNENYVPAVSALSNLDPAPGSTTYSVNILEKDFGAINSWSLPPSVLDMVQYQSTPAFLCGNQLPQAVQNLAVPSAVEAVLVLPIDLGEATNYAGGVIALFQGADQAAALWYSYQIAADSPDLEYLVTTYSGGNPLLGFDVITIQATGVYNSSCGTFSPGPSSEIDGKVQTSLGVPVPGATVTAMGENQQSVQTDATGAFTISNLSAANYVLQTVKTGYVPSTDSVTLAPGANDVHVTLPSTAAATSVQFSSGPPYTVTIAGKGFGTAVASMPFSGDLSNFSIVDESCYAITPGKCEEGFSGDTFGLAYQSWSDTQIVAGGYSEHSSSHVAMPGDAVEIGIWNGSSQRGAAGFVWGGNLPPVSAGTPQISTVLFSGDGANLNIAILGSGFGSSPPANVPAFSASSSYIGFTSNLRLGDYAGRFPQATASVDFRAGFQNPANGVTDPVSIQYISWSDSQIVLGGFGSEYGSNSLTVQSGDPVTITVWSTSSGLATAWGGYVP